MANKWRQKNPKKWQEHKKKYYDQFRPAINERQKYTDYENSVIIVSELSDRELHERLGRSVEAIQVQRSKLRKRIGHTLFIRYKNHV